MVMNAKMQRNPIAIFFILKVNLGRFDLITCLQSFKQPKQLLNFLNSRCFDGYGHIFSALYLQI